MSDSVNLKSQEAEIKKNRIHGTNVRVTWDEFTAVGARFGTGLNLTVLGLMVATADSVHALGGEELIAPARSSEKDRKFELVGREATGFVITTLSVSFVSISN